MKSRLSSATLPLSLSPAAAAAATYDKAGGATLELDAGGALRRRRKPIVMLPAPLRPIPFEIEAPTIITKRGGAAITLHGAGARDRAILRTGGASFRLGAGGTATPMRLRSGGAAMELAGGGLLRITRGEHLDLVDLAILGVLTIDDLIAAGVPEEMLEEALALI